MRKWRLTVLFANISKKERLQVTRQKVKMEKFLGSIADLTRIPAALFIVDVKKEHIAVSEAKKLNIPTFAIVDTNADPNEVDFPIPGNDDATKAISTIMAVISQAIEEGLAERKMDKDADKENEPAAEEGIAAEPVVVAELTEEEVVAAAEAKKAKAAGGTGRPRKATAAKKRVKISF